MSHKLPPFLREAFFMAGAARINGTGDVVCAVKGPPVIGSFIISLLPWSAVIIALPPFSNTEPTTRFTHSSTVLNASTAAA